MEVKHIEGFSDYTISELGEVISYKRNKPKSLIPDLNKEGYLRVVLSLEGETYRFSVHRLVATHFIPNPENKPFVNHKDGNKQNNHKSNLEWCDCSYNTVHAYDNMLRLHSEDAPNAQITDEVVHEVCKLIQQGLKRGEVLAKNLHPRLTKSKFDDIRRRKCWKRISENYQW